MCCEKSWVTIGATMGAIGVILGAFAAHGLDSFVQEMYQGTKMIAGMEVPVSWKYVQDFKTAADYQMYHSLALVAVGILAQRQSRKSLNVAAWSFLSGTIVFSGSLYLLVMTGQTKLGMITPIGGVLFIVGWIALAFAACPCSQPSIVPLETTLPTEQSSPR